ncbi:hypothetical protein [Morganella morganii]|uniref:hypothetical protein n=1 Tax=Morganella morganii TaxID=582 RepID=UPI000BCF9401|nr:hypothetical protein [Morganella morganii]ELT0454761.1 hypothetical protein [Morganella morganii]MBT0337412.1 hypothetical protein [Morganella morganii subsp. morganii]PCP71696.1 hypothetical protein CQA25_17615 [Morganella morganii]HCU0871593.1 hypothetical protein [Morganella morganii]HCU0899345.1 hypothetical protein [Morganella morganii]
MENKCVVIEIGAGDKVFSTLDYKDEQCVGLSISERKDNNRDIGNKFTYPEGTTIGDLEPIIVVVTQNINSLISLRDQVDDVIALLKSKCEAGNEQIS